MPYTSVDDSLMRLEWLEKCRDYTSPVRIALQTLNLELKFLAVSLWWTANRCSKNKYLNDFLMRIETHMEDVDQTLQSLCPTRDCYLDNYSHFICQLSEVLGKITSFRPDIKQVYLNFSNPKLSLKPLKVDALVEFVDSLLRNLGLLLHFNINSFLNVKEQIEALQLPLKSLRIFLAFTAKQCTDQQNQRAFSSHVEAIADSTARLSYLCLVEEMDDAAALALSSDLSHLIEISKPTLPRSRKLYIKLLKNSKPSQPVLDKIDEISVAYVDFLLYTLKELLSDKSSQFIIIHQDEINVLVDELTFLKTLLMDPPEPYMERENLISFLTNITAILVEAGSTVYSLSDTEIDEDNAREMHLMLLNLLEKIRMIKAEVREIYAKIPRSAGSNFPTTDELGFVDSLIWDLNELLNDNVNSMALVRKQILAVHDELKSMRILFEETRQLSNKKELRDLLTRMVALAYNAEFVIDSVMVFEYPLWYLILWVPDTVEEIKSVNSDIAKIRERNANDRSSLSSRFELSAFAKVHLPVQSVTSTVDDVMVNYHDATVVREHLTRGPSKLDVISIVGMLGIGKTQLAKRLYNDPSISNQFDVTSWCCVSQEYQKKDLWLEILGNIREPLDDIYDKTEEVLPELLPKILRRRKYLIVVDDVWSAAAWDDLVKAFPDDNNGSRIILTTQLDEVAFYAKGTYRHCLNFLTEGESWKLLEEKLFGHEKCPEELVDVGMIIANQCQGLPLLICITAGLLHNTEKEILEWEEIAENWSLHIIDKDRLCMALVNFSYQQLPHYLRQCFLYLGVFSRCGEVSVSRLRWLWTTEGFIRQNDDKKSVDDVAEDFLKDLIGRNLVMVSERTSRGRIKKCYVHDLVHYFCLEKAREEHFFQPLYVHDQDSSEYASSLCPETQLHQRLCISSEWNQFMSSKPFCPQVRSLLFIAATNEYSYPPIDLCLIQKSFKLLKVLDLLGIIVARSFLDGIGSLLHLKYLAIRGEMNSIPSSIDKLWNLQIFIVKATRGEVELPFTIWNMKKLRHLHIRDRASFSLEKYKSLLSENSSQLPNLETLSTPSLYYGEEAEEILRRLPHLHKLEYIFRESWNSRRNQFPVLSSLNQLRSLKVSAYGRIRHPCEFNFPLLLKKLTLSKFWLPWKEISTVGQLPNLEVLRLIFNACDGEEWEMTVGQFPKLKFLKLDTLNIKHWRATRRHLPHLQHLVLRSCTKLEKIPYELGNLRTLQVIEVDWCSRSTADSALHILEEQQEQGYEGLKVNIHPCTQ